MRKKKQQEEEPAAAVPSVDPEEFLIEQLRNFLHDRLDVWVFPYHFPSEERCKDAIPRRADREVGR